MALSVVGDAAAGSRTAVKTIVVDNKVAKVTGAQLAAKANAINITGLSGKKAGSIVLNTTTNELHVATGSLDVSTWVNQGAVAAIITPA